MRDLGTYGVDVHSVISTVCFLAVTEIYILEDTAPGTVIYRAAAKDPEDGVLEVIHILGERTSMLLSGFMCD